MIDPNQLYRLAIATGTTLDLEKCCERFLGALMDVKDLSVASVWLEHEHLVGQDTAYGESAEQLYVRFYQRPADRKGTVKIPPSHPLVVRLEERNPLALRLADDLLDGVLEGGAGSRGHVAVFRLGRLGFLVCCATERRIGFSQSEFHELRDPLAVFVSSVEGCLAFQAMSRESARRTRLEAAVRRSEEHWRALIENGLDVILLLDYDGTVRFASPSVSRALGYPVEEFEGSSLMSFAHPEDVSDLMGRFRGELMTPGIGPTFDLRLRHAAGHWLVFEVRTNSLLSLQSVAGIILNCRDVTDAKEQERALEEARLAALAASRARGEFLANMSHEIRTPLNGVLGMTSLLLDTELTEEQKEFAQTVATSGRALLAIVDQVLDFSKIESGTIDLHLAPFDLRQCVEEVVDTVAPAAVAKGIDLWYRLSDRVPPVVVGDMVKIRQILLNLVSNATKYTDRGEVTVEVDVRDHPTQQDTLECAFSVRDTGVGIPAAKLDELFQPFRQVDPSAARARGGTGLGLAISRQLCESLGGRIWAESTEGEGTTLQFTMPASPAADRAPAGRADVTEGVERALGDRMVLIGHPRATGRSHLAELLEHWGARVHPVKTPADVLEALRSRQVLDAVVLGFAPEEQSAILSTARRKRRRRNLPFVLLRPLGDGSAEVGADSDAQVTRVALPLRHGRLLQAVAEVLEGEAKPAPTDRAESGIQRDGGIGGLRVLLADDNPMNRRISQLMLARLGIEADQVENGIQVLEALRSAVYDVILMDIRMPEMDGIEATRRIRQEENGPQPRIVAVTAQTLPGDREQFIQIGMDDVVTKPLQLEELSAVLRNLPAPEERREAVIPELDQQVIEGLRCLRRPGFLAAVIANFDDSARRDLERLESALAEDQLQTVAETAHHLLGSCLSVGAARLAETCREIERTARAGDVSGGLAHALERAGVEYDSVRSILAEHGED